MRLPYTSTSFIKNLKVSTLASGVQWIHIEDSSVFDSSVAISINAGSFNEMNNSTTPAFTPGIATVLKHSIFIKESAKILEKITQSVSNVEAGYTSWIFTANTQNIKEVL